MSEADLPQDADFQQASSQLNEGLKSCRAVVNNYRAILTADPAAANDDEPGGLAGYVSTTDTAADNDPGGWNESA